MITLSKPALSQEETSYVPKVGDFFHIEFRNGDRSWANDIYECLSCRPYSILGLKVHGEHEGLGLTKRLFIVDDVVFYNAASHAKALGFISVEL